MPNTALGLPYPSASSAPTVQADLQSLATTLNGRVIFPCTAATRPTLAAADKGVVIFETDTLLFYWWTGSAWQRVITTDTSGRVGVGTTNADLMLTVQSTGATQVSLKNSSGVSKAYIGTDGSFGTAGTDDLRIRSEAAAILFGFSGTERMRLASDGLLTGTGTSLGAWTAYTPTLGGFTAGNGTWAAGYAQVGKAVHFRAQFTFGSTSAAAAASPTISLPVTSLTAANVTSISGYFNNAGTQYQAFARLTSTTVATLSIPGASGLATACSTTTPFTWTTGSIIVVSGTYEAA